MTAQCAYSLRQLAETRGRHLHEFFIRGEAPDMAALAGWEYHGVNMPATLPKLLGIRRFIKGFLADGDGGLIGYNKQVVGADLDSPWTPRPRHDGRERYAYFAVRTVDAGGVESRHLNALLFDYGTAPEPEPGIASRLRDYVVRVVPGSDDLLLGRAYLAIGRRRVPVGWFAIDRANPN
jgi:hypothetical protein